MDRMYPIVIFDALWVKILDADSRMLKNKAVYVALGVDRDGLREVFGAVDRRQRRGQVLAFGDERTEQPGPPGHPDCRSRWTERLSRSHQDTELVPEASPVL